jgi:hypothetical protein
MPKLTANKSRPRCQLPAVAKEGAGHRVPSSRISRRHPVRRRRGPPRRESLASSDIDIRWNKVTLALTTHDEGGLTRKDFALAEKFDRLAR